MQIIEFDNIVDKDELYFEGDNSSNDIKEFLEFIDLFAAKDKLEYFQKVDVIDILRSETKGTIVTHEMGLGKSYMILYMAIITKLMEPYKKVLITAPSDSIEKITNLVKSNTAYNVMSSTGDARKVERLINEFDNLDIIIVQQSIWSSSVDFHIFMYNNVDKFSINIYDEMASKNAAGGAAFAEMSKHITKTVVLNATVFDNSIDKIYNSLNTVSALRGMTKERFTQKYKITDRKSGKVILKTVDLVNDFGKFISNKNRSDLGINIKVNMKFIRITPTEYQKNLIRISNDVRKSLSAPTMLKGFVPDNVPLVFTKKEVPSLSAVFYVINQLPKDENLVIYCNYIHAVSRIANELRYNGRDVYLITGESTKTPKEKKDVEDAFNAFKGGIAIITIEKAISLNSAKSMILYEIPQDLSQTIFRIIRGSNDKEVDVYQIYYPMYHLGLLKEKLNTIEANDVALNRNSGIDKQLAMEINYTQTNINRYM